MGDIRVQDEQGNVHVFPDGSTPEMIAQAMGVKPPTPLPSAASPIAPPRMKKPLVNMQEVYLDSGNPVTTPQSPKDLAVGAAKNLWQVSAPGIATSIINKQAPSVARNLPSAMTRDAAPVRDLPGQIMSTMLPAIAGGMDEPQPSPNPQPRATQPAVGDTSSTWRQIIRHPAAEIAGEIPGVGGIIRKARLFDRILNRVPEAEPTPSPQPIPETNGIPWGTGGQGPLDLRGQRIPQSSPPQNVPITTPRVSPKFLQDSIERGLGNQQPLGVRPGVPIRSQIPFLNKTEPIPQGHNPVESSALNSYKYDPTTREFEAVTKNGGHYVYGDVDPEQAAAFEQAGSKGKAFGDLKKNSTLVAKVINGKRVAVTPTSSPVADPNDLTDILTRSLRQVEK